MERKSLTMVGTDNMQDTEQVKREMREVGHRMNRILDAIRQKEGIGYSEAQLEVDYGYVGNEGLDECWGYYLSKLNAWGTTPITGILAQEGDFDEKDLTAELDRMGIAYCLR